MLLDPHSQDVPLNDRRSPSLQERFEFEIMISNSSGLAVPAKSLSERLEGSAGSVDPAELLVLPSSVSVDVLALGVQLQIQIPTNSKSFIEMPFSLSALNSHRVLDLKPLVKFRWRIGKGKYPYNKLILLLNYCLRQRPAPPQIPNKAVTEGLAQCS